MRIGIALFGLALALAAPSHANQKSIYSWVDDKGVTHFGERAPQHTQSTQVRRGKISADSTTSQPSIWQDGVAKREPDAQQNKISTREVAKIDLERCNAAIKNLELLQTGKNLRITNEDGSTRPMTRDEVQSSQRDMQRAIDESCQDQSKAN